jgi:DNA-binding IclR family transcriptional regulator
MVHTAVQNMNSRRLSGSQAVRRAIDVLFCLDADTPSLTAAEVATRLDINRTTAWRYLQTFVGTGLVRELGEGRFALGVRCVSLAEAYTSQWGEIEAVAGAALVSLRDRVGETAALHLRQGWTRVVVRQVESRYELHRTYRELGQPISLLDGAPSRAILAALAPVDCAAYLDAHLDDADRRAHVEQVLTEVRAHGFAQTRGDRVRDVASVAAAVRDPHGDVVGALNVTGPAHRLLPGRVAEIAGEVTAAAAWVEEQLASSALAARAAPEPGSPDDVTR